MVFLGQHICYTNYIASEVVSFYHMGTKVQLNYVCQLGKSNVQSLIDLSTDIMSHQMKRIGNGRQDVQQVLLKTWKIL